MRMETSPEEAINKWHASVNAGDLQRSATTVGDPVVVLGPKGAGPITPTQFAESVERSGIKLPPRSWPSASERLMAVEEDVTWPESTTSTRVATVFRASDGKIRAQLTTGWNDKKRQEFQQATADLMDRSYAMDA